MKVLGIVSAVFAQAEMCSLTSPAIFVLLFQLLVAARVATSWFANSSQDYWVGTGWPATGSTHITLRFVRPFIFYKSPPSALDLLIIFFAKLLSRVSWRQFPACSGNSVLGRGKRFCFWFYFSGSGVEEEKLLRKKKKKEKNQKYCTDCNKWLPKFQLLLMNCKKESDILWYKRHSVKLCEQVYNSRCVFICSDIYMHLYIHLSIILCLYWSLVAFCELSWWNTHAWGW